MTDDFTNPLLTIGEWSLHHWILSKGSNNVVIRHSCKKSYSFTWEKSCVGCHIAIPDQILSISKEKGWGTMGRLRNLNDTYTIIRESSERGLCQKV